jgi:hypothetical protein
MTFAYGTVVVRERRKLIPSPANPQRLIAGSWDDVDALPLPGAAVGSSSSTSLRTATRQEVLTAKSLYLRNPDADVKVGDRIRFGADVYYVHAKPAADQNPFTGRRPGVEIPLEENAG